ncbi:ribosome biogenesis GTPase Der [candidate division NPL-UPA2 bacterium]|nr:ribosome biogenesis GTPase Der [candidate division NPL-UPA2 bacterium]
MREKCEPLMAIVGRPNVGKSTLFNRIIGERRAIVEREPGVTRDRIYAEGEWGGKSFSLIDTGGLVPDASQGISSLIKEQVRIAIQEADLILLLVDAQCGPTSVDEEIGRRLRKADKPIILAVNKVDNLESETAISNFYQLGLGEPVPISAIHGLRINELLDKVMELLPDEKAKAPPPGIKVAVVGRPNVGKSSFINALLQEERLIVDEEPGTTRDAVDTIFRLGEERFIFIDTAGMRQRGKVRRGVESYSIARAQGSLERCDIALLLFDAWEGVSTQDSRIAGYIEEKGKGVIIVGNKWDLVIKNQISKIKNQKCGKPHQPIIGKPMQAMESEMMKEYREIIRKKLPFLFAPIIFVSALTGHRVLKVIDLLREVTREQMLRPAKSILDRVFQEAKSHRPPGRRAKPVRLQRLKQVGIKPPTFAFYADNPEFISESYRRYLSNRLRQAFGFQGTPIKIISKGKRKR